MKATIYTYVGSKSAERICKYCSFHDKKIVRIPQRIRSSGFSGGWNSGSWGGSFGGGSSEGGSTSCN